MPDANDIAYFSAAALGEAYRARQLSPVEVVEALSARIERLEPQLNAFCIVDRDGALLAARAAEERWQRGSRSGRSTACR